MTKKDSKKSLRPGSKSARSTASKRRSASRKAGSKSSRSAKSSKSAKSRKAKSSKGPSSKSGRKSGSASSKKSTSASRRQKKSLGAGLATAVDKSNKSDKEKCKTAVCPSDKETKVDVAAQAKELQDKVGGAAPKTVEMRMQPAELVWKQNGGVKQVHIVNNSKERRAVKVKCTDNLLYRVHPVCGFVDPGESYKVEVLRNNGSTKSDVLLFMTTKAGEQKEARECFADKAQQNEMLVLPMLPEKDDVAV
ncbi:unnamed protein product, partial [Mesorhabditis spiculigera]